MLLGSCGTDITNISTAPSRNLPPESVESAAGEGFGGNGPVGVPIRKAQTYCRDMSTVVILLGPPGSGKTTVGSELERLGLRWREWEMTILRRWGSRANFVANKTVGLRLLQDEIRAFIELPGRPAAIETTGLSDAEFLDALAVDYAAFCVRLDVSESECVRRVGRRARGRHLTDDVEVSRAIWREFYEQVAPIRAGDLVIDTEGASPTSAAARIVVAIGPLEAA